eukprot:gene1440-1815_t
MGNIGRIVSVPLGLILIAAGIIIWVVVNDAIHKELRNASITLPKNNKDANINPWTRFVTNEGDPNNKRDYIFYVYNLTNPTEMVKGQYPKYEELGPYKYKYVYARINATLIEDDNKVSFKFWKRYYAITDEEGYRNPLTDVIYHFNPAYLGAVQTAGGEQKLAIMMGAGTMARIGAQLNTPSFYLQAKGAASPVVNKGIYDAIVGSGAGDAGACAVWATDSAAPPTVPAQWQLKSANQAGADLTQLHTACTTGGIFDPTKPLSLTNRGTTEGWGAWTAALNVTSPAFTALKNNVKAAYQLVLSKLLDGCSGCQETDLGYLQWGMATGILNNQSVFAFLPQGSIPAPPEFGIKYQMSLSLQSSKTLFNEGAPMNLVTPKGVGTFLEMVKANQFAQIQTATGLDTPQAAKVAEYFTQYIVPVFVGSTIQNQIVGGNGGPFAKHTVNDFFFNATDPLLALLFPGDRIKQSSNTLSNITSEELAMQLLPTDISWTGNSNADLTQVPVTFHGNEYLHYAEEIPITGNFPEQLGPYFLDESESPEVVLFSEEYARALPMERVVSGALGGLPYYRYRIKDSLWKANPTYFNSIDYLLNMSAPLGKPVFLSRPRMKGVNVKYFTNAGLSALAYDQNDTDVFASFEPRTGKAIHGRYSLQINCYIPGAEGSNSTLFGTFFQLKSDVIHPLLFGTNEIMATDSQIDAINHAYKLDATRYGLTVILIVVGSYITLCAIGLYIFDIVKVKEYCSSTWSKSLSKGNEDPIIYHRDPYSNKDYFIVGTSHISKGSAELVKKLIRDVQPDHVVVELCQARFNKLKAENDVVNLQVHQQSSNNNNKSFIMELFQMMSTGQLNPANIVKKLMERFYNAFRLMGIIPGLEFKWAIKEAELIGSKIVLGDLPVDQTMKSLGSTLTSEILPLMTQLQMGGGRHVDPQQYEFLEKLQNYLQPVMNVLSRPTINEEELEREFKRFLTSNNLKEMRSNFKLALPKLSKAMLTDREENIVKSIRDCPGNRIVIVVGGLHLEGIREGLTKKP